jgi:folate-binding protein YgfZ
MRTVTLADLHAARGARLGERGGAQVVLGYGDLAAEHARLGTVALVDRSHRGLIGCRGPETRSYLHGMVTNEVKALAPGQGTYAAVITARGKMLGDVRLLLVAPEDALLDMEPEAHAGTLAHLEQFLISEDCELRDADGELALLGLYGPNAGEVVAAVAGAAPSLPLHHHTSARIAGVPVRLVAAAPAGVPGFEVLVPPSSAAAVFAALEEAVRAAGGGLAGDDALERARVEHGVPRYGADMDENTIPLEANLEHAISYTKGCYIGQEVIAKATYRGHVRRKLVRLQVPPGTAAGAQLVDGEKPLGQVTSVIPGEDRALGYVRASLLQVGARAQLEGGGEATVTWAPPPKE